MTQVDSYQELLQRNPPQIPDDKATMLLKEFLRVGFKLDRVHYVWQDETPAFIVTFMSTTNQAPARPELVEWSAGVEEFFFLSGVKMATPDEEALRIAHLILRQLKILAQKWATPIVDRALYDIARELFAEKEKLSRLVNASKFSDVDQAELKACTLRLRDILGGYANSLRLELKYPEDDAKNIFFLAVIKVLDDRFHISTRRHLDPATR